MKTLSLLLAGLSLVLLSATPDARAEEAKYALRYHFRPGETLRWQVTHRTQTRTTVAGATQLAETLSKSVKAWRVKEVRSDGTAVFEHLVEEVDMRNTLTGSPEVRYNSRTDKEPPKGFTTVAESIGVPLSTVTMDVRGQILRRRQQQAKPAAQNRGQMTIPLPEEPIAVGHTWSFPEDVEATLPTGGVRRIKAIQTYTLAGVKTGVATIETATRIITPIDDPALESQVMQHRTRGTVRFDVEAGRILSQQMDVDEHCVGFRGDASSLHYVTRFTEAFLDSPAQTAAVPSGEPGPR